MSTILDTYRVQFYKRKIGNKYFTLMSSVSDALNLSITDYQIIDLISNFLLSEINNVLTGVSSVERVISQSMVSMVIFNTETNFYLDPDYDPSDPPDFSLPTLDLKAIAQAWLAFITAHLPVN